ncbi:TolB family protein [Leifsonia shinshuensis]
MKAVRLRWLLVAVTVLALGGAVAYATVAIAQYQSRATATVVATPKPTVPAGSRLVFRDTSPGAHYGQVASVPLADPSAARTSTGLVCDRVYATHQNLMCLHTDSGTHTSFGATLYDAGGDVLNTWPLPGFPSRTRISPDSSLVAQTSFVTGSSYGTAGFSTQTTISAVSGIDYGNLEKFALIVNGQQVTADHDIWGVTFSSDDNTFFATAMSEGRIWLVRGNLRARALVAVKDGAECPSLSPDGTRVAYKKNISTTATKHWTLAVLDFATGVEKELPIPPSVSVDDQAEWLDDGTLLYGLADPKAPGDSNVYAVKADGSAAPTLFLRHAWSPSVVH